MTNLDNKYLIASDLDGTLLTDNKKLRFKTRLYLKKLEENGNIVILSTGRPVRTAISFYKKLKINSPIICYNGAYSFNPNNPSFKAISYPIKKEVIIKHYSYFKEHFADSVLCESLDYIYYDGKKEIFGFTLIRDINDPKFMPKEIDGDIAKNLKDDVYCFILHSLNNTEKFVKEVQEYVAKNMPDYIVDFWNENRYFEIRHKGVNKASAIKKINELYKIKEDNILTFGDSTNDKELVTSFKHGFGMKNGKDYLKTHNSTKKDNNHNGVVFEIKSFLKSRV